MIRHIVMLRLAAAPGDELASVMSGLAALVGRIGGFKAFEHGRNRDAEGKSPDYPYGFICTFDDADALTVYAEDAEHRSLGARLVALCGGGEGIMVYDLDLRAT